MSITPPRDPDPAGVAPRRFAATPPRVDTGAEPLSDRHGDVFFAAVETTRMPMIVTDPRLPDNPIVFANAAFLAMTGYGHDEIVGRNCRFLQGDETDTATVTEIREAIAAAREVTVEILNYRKDGYAFWNALFISPIFNAADELVYFFASQLDITRRREAEAELRQAQKMEALGRLTGGIAHDFNNLLQVMVGYLELLGSGLRKETIDRDKLMRGIDNARGAADRAAALTQQLLAFARRQRLEGRVVDLNALAGGVGDLAGRTLGADVTVTTTLADGLWNCRVDPTQVEVALLNILVNARDAMAGRPDRRVAIETRNMVIEADDARRIGGKIGAGRYASIAVVDTGAGMPPALVDRVMDPFFTTKEEGKGTGLGLSMVYGFAKQSGGAAHIESVEGEGTTVRLYFPAVDEPAPPANRRGGWALDRPGDEHILLVEDRDDVAEMAQLILKDLGYRVLRAADARAALDMLDADGTIDLLFTDLVMPGRLDGVALAREAKRRRPHLKVLLTTGYVEASVERNEAGGREFDLLDKPYGRSELARKVRLVLDGPTGVS